MIVIGGSLGGMKALRVILRGLSASLPLPVAVVLHRHRESDNLLISLLQQESPLPISEAIDKESILPGRVYIAPADYHLLVDPPNLSLSTDDPIQYARPSIDVLFESAADTLGEAVIAVVLTGANQDGARGAARVVEKGGLVLVQDPATADNPVMPLAAIQSTGTEFVRTLEEIGALLVKLAAAAAAKNV